MINTARSSRSRAWKYLLTLPVLAIAAGLLSASNPSVVKEAPGEKYVDFSNGNIFILLTAKTSDEDIKGMQQMLSDKGIQLNILKGERNSAGEFTTLSAEIKKGEGGAKSDEMSVKGKPVRPMFFEAHADGVIGTSSSASAIASDGEPAWPKRLLKIAVDESPWPISGLTTDSSYKRSFPGGEDGLAKFLSANIRYPHTVLEENKPGIVAAQYKLHPDGKVTDIIVTNKGSVDPLLAEEVIRVLKKMPTFMAEPGSPVETITMTAGFFVDSGKGTIKPERMPEKGPDIVIVGYGKAR